MPTKVIYTLSTHSCRCITPCLRCFFIFCEQGMPLLKEDKKLLAKQYLEQLDGATNAVILSHAWIPVNEMNAVRMDIVEAQGTLKSVKKRVLLKAVDGKYDGLTEEALDGSVMVVYSHNEEDQHAPLKVIAKHKKIWKKAKHEFGFDFVWGWYEKVWKGEWFVTEIADLPSKEELVGKFLFLLTHPVASFARWLKAIADLNGEETPVEEVKEVVVEETKEEAAE